MNAGRIVDLSQPVDPDTPVFPGDGPVRVTILEESSINLSRLDLSLHTGTHMDAPFHFFRGSDSIDQVPLARCIGPARLIDLRPIPNLTEIGPPHIEPHRETIVQARLVILQTGWSAHWNRLDYFTGHPCLSPQAAQLLLDWGIQLVGVDMPSVDREPYPAHRILLGAGALIVENLTNLDAIGSSAFQLIVLPLKLSGRDGSPVRAVAIV